MTACRLAQVVLLRCVSQPADAEIVVPDVLCDNAEHKNKHFPSLRNWTDSRAIAGYRDVFRWLLFVRFWRCRTNAFGVPANLGHQI